MSACSGAVLGDAIVQTTTGLFVKPPVRPSTTPVRDRREYFWSARAVDRRVDGEHGIDIVGGKQGRDCRLDTRCRRPRRCRSIGLAMPAAVGGTSSPPATHASAARMPGPPALVTIATRRPGGKRLRIEARGDVEHLVDRVGTNHARLLKETVDRQLARGESGRMACGGAQPGGRAAGFDDHNRLRRVTRASRAARSGADCRTTRDRAARQTSTGRARRIEGYRCRRCPPCCRGSQMSTGQSAVWRRDSTPRARDRHSATRARCARVAAGAPRTRHSARSSGSVLRTPMQLGPTMRMP